DLTSALVHAVSDDGSPVLSTSEVVNLIGTILSAGSSTTVNFITLLMRQLLLHPDQAAEVMRRDSSRPRWSGPRPGPIAPTVTEQRRSPGRSWREWSPHAATARRACRRDSG